MEPELIEMMATDAEGIPVPQDRAVFANKANTSMGVCLTLLTDMLKLNRIGDQMLILLALLLVLLFFGLGFTLHALWVVAVVLFAFWVVGLAIGRGEGAGRRHFYRW